MILLLRKCAGTTVDRLPALGIGHIKHRKGQISNGTNLTFLKKDAYPSSPGQTVAYPPRVFGCQHTDTSQFKAINPYRGIHQLTSSYPYFRLFNQRPLKSLANFQPYRKFHASTTVNFQTKPSEGDGDDRDKPQTDSRFKARLMVIRFFSALIAYLLLAHRKGTEDSSSKLQGTKELPKQLQQKDLISGEDDAQQRVKDAIKGIQLEDVVKMANGLVDKNQYIQALHLYSTVTTRMEELEERNFSPDEKLVFISDLIELISIAARRLLESDPTARKTVIGLGLMHIGMLLDGLHLVEGSDELYKNVMEAGSVHNVVCLTTDLNEYDDAIQLCEMGFALLKKHRGDKAADFFYGLLLNDMGGIKLKLSKFSDAEQFFLRALKLCERVSNVKEQIIQEQIAVIKKNLVVVQKQLRNEC